MKNGFFRSRRFAQASEAGSVELFSEERDSGEEAEESSYQVAAQRRIDRLEKEEFIRKCKVRMCGRNHMSRKVYLNLCFLVRAYGT